MQQSDPFDPAGLRVPASDPPVLPKLPSKRPPRHRPGEPFLKGPIPWPWLATAARLPGKTLHVAVLLWKEAGCRKSRTVALCLSWAGELGVREDSARRALRHMAAAGLVRVRHRPGRCLEVTLLDLTRESSEP
jgi:hypothetical protein